MRQLMYGKVCEFFAGETKFVPEFGKIFIDQPEREFIIAGGGRGWWVVKTFC